MSIRLGNNIVAGRSPYQPSLFDFKWADHVLTDPQWVRADTNLWHNRSVFTPAYDHLLADIQDKEAQSETIEGIIITYYLASDGHKICLSDQVNYLNALYEKTGVAWYYVIDTTTQSFKVPRSKWNVVGIRGDVHDVVGKFETFALPNAASEGTTKTAASQMYLYFYIGNFTQTAIENTAGANLADIEEVMDESTTAIQNIVSEGIEAIDTAMADLDTMINAQYHPNIFEQKWSDHILNDIQWLRGDTFSWQSGEVYETAYQHLVSDITGKAPQYRYFPNVECKGETKVNENGILSGFVSTSSYGVINGLYKPTTSFELVVKAKLPTTITNSQNIVGSDPTVNYTGAIIRVTSATTINLWISSNGSSWNVVDNGAYTYNNITPGEDIWIKLTWDGSIYTIYASIDGINYTSIGTVSSTAVMNYSTGKASLGGYEIADRPFTDGTIDLKESYIKIDGNLVWKGVDTLTYYEGDDGHRICLADQENQLIDLYNKTGSAWYYILDQENTRFKLPRKHSTQIIESVKNSDGSWYKLYSDGWVEQGGKIIYGSTAADIVVSLPVKMESTNYQTSITLFGNTSGLASAINGNYFTIWNRTTMSFTTHRYNAQTVQQMWQVSGQSVVDVASLKADEKYRYFYVGKFLQSAVVNTAALNMELFNSKVDVGHEVIGFQAPTSENGYTWYRKYADGWIEQGGYIAQQSSSGLQSVVLPMAMRDEFYNFSATAIYSANGSTDHREATNELSAKTATEFTKYIWANWTQFIWKIEGMAA